MHPDSIYVLNIQSFLDFQKLKEDSRYRKGYLFPIMESPGHSTWAFILPLTLSLVGGAFFLLGNVVIKNILISKILVRH
jgi:hypothetical protein